MPKVKSTEAAVTAANQMNTTISTLLTELTTLGKTGDRLNDPTVWLGNDQKKFAAIWPQAKSSNQKLIQELQKLQKDIHTVLLAIQRAGGG